tara:strand:- start:1226 stop:3310 length:2085 start_codon:yes stop_codon:yes gene_type:complete
MATFKTQIEDITGSVGDDAALTQWLTDGAKEIINILPYKLKEKCATISILNATNGTTLDMDSSGEVLQVTRLSANSGGYQIPCRNIHPMYGDLANDSSSLHYATVTDPVYWTTSNSSGASTLFVKPTATDSQPSNVYRIVYPSVANGDSVIANFPDEAEYLVVLYAAIKGLHRLQNDFNSNSDITTALTAVNTELDETQAVCDLINTQTDSAVSSLSSATTEIGLANAEVDKMAAESALDNAELDKATSELGEAVTLVDSGIDTATAAIATAAGRINTAVALANTEFDKCDAILDLGETDTEGDVNTALTAMNTELDETQAVCDLLNAEVDKAFAEVALANAEADEMASQTDGSSSDLKTALDAINTALDKFRADASDPALFGDEHQYLTGVGLTHVKDALELARDAIDTGFATDEDSGGSDDATPKSAGYWLNDEDTEMVQATLQTAQTEIQRAQVHIAEWNATVQALSAEADGFAKEAQSRVAFTGAKGQVVQSYISTANGYIKTAQGYGAEIQSKINISSGYAQEVQSRLAQAKAKREESGARIAAGNAYLQEAKVGAEEAQSYVNEVNARVAQVNAQVGVAQGYIANGTGYSRVADSYAKAAQGYIGTAQGYIANAQGYVNAAQGFVNEVQSKIAIASGYIGEANARIQIDDKRYQWLQVQQLKLQQDYDKGVQMLISKGMPQPKQERAK